jgi:hypothetical protein
MLTIIQNTPAVLIPELDLVKEKYIQNYNACNKEKNGELMYHRNVIHMKQAIANVPGLIECDPFSLYACFATAAVNGYSLDPGDDEVYLIPRGGKAYLAETGRRPHTPADPDGPDCPCRAGEAGVPGR